MNEKKFFNLKKYHIKDKFIFMKEKINLNHIIIFIISSIIIASNSNINYTDLDESIYSYITLKIGNGYYKFYSTNYQNPPNIVYINEIKQTTIEQPYRFVEDENSVILIWKKPITNCQTNCQNMFQSCDKIIEMDLTHFDTSKVNNTANMFDGCKNLKYLNISNIDTSKVEDMGVMFRDCSSLTTLDLSSFNTSSNTNIGNMFKGCSSLKSINLSNFDTSKTTCLDNLLI